MGGEEGRRGRVGGGRCTHDWAINTDFCTGQALGTSEGGQTATALWGRSPNCVGPEASMGAPFRQGPWYGASGHAAGALSRRSLFSALSEAEEVRGGFTGNSPHPLNTKNNPSTATRVLPAPQPIVGMYPLTVPTESQHLGNQNTIFLYNIHRKRAI